MIRTLVGSLFYFIFIILMASISKAGMHKPSAEKIVQDMEKAREKVNEQDLRQRQVMSSLFTITKRMKSIVREKSTMEQDRATIEASNKELAKKIINLSDLLREQKTALRARLAVISRMSGQSLARILFSSSNSAALERNLKILGLIAKRDMDLIKDYFKSVALLKKRKQKLASRMDELKRLEVKIHDKEKNLVSENIEKSKILQHIRKSRQASMDKLKQLRKESEEMDTTDDPELYDLLYRPSFYEAKGQLPIPVEGRIRRGYGVVRDSEHNLSWLHKGHFYSTSSISEVKAVFEGKVAFAGVLPGYGKALILDHGDHFYSVYAGVQDIQVVEGSEVKQSEKIASSGQSQFEHGRGLYFEIRHFSEPVDPQGWVKGSQL
jgi:septal ring factor EnvC (AmiA/AmiB activator)